MHAEAILKKGSGKIAGTGSLVTIDAVEKVYKSSAAANAVETFICADGECGVAVLAIITQRSKAGRKKSPSSYFRASPKPHRPGCTRRASGTATNTPAVTGSKSASPIKASVPSIWREAETSSGPKTIDTSGSVSTHTKGGSSGGYLSSGTGTNRRSSNSVEVFATYWKDMASSRRRSKQLTAGWNTGDTYESAFVNLISQPLAGSVPSRKKIYYGSISRIHSGTSGFSLTLSQTHSSGVELLIWVKKITEDSGSLGASLWKRLSHGGVALGSEVFALGQFDHNARGTRVWHALPIVDGHDIWIP